MNEVKIKVEDFPNSGGQAAVLAFFPKSRCWYMVYWDCFTEQLVFFGTNTLSVGKTEPVDFKIHGEPSSWIDIHNIYEVEKR